MPLYRGINALADETLHLEEEVLLGFFDQREAILSVFRADPDLLDLPYPYQTPWSRTDGRPGYVIPGGFPDDNPIFEAIKQSGLWEHGRSALMGDDLWQRLAEKSAIEGRIAKRDFGEAYALIDVSIYLVHLMNIYQPNRALIQNLVATHTQTDALGRENLKVTQAAISKLIKKSLGRPDYLWADQQAGDLIAIAKHDAAQSRQAPKAGKGIDFERRCKQLLEEAGFEVRATPATGDYGADLVASKDDIEYAIQCKDTGKPVGVKAVQEAAGSRAHYRTDYAVVCCSAGFTDAAIELATSNKVLLCSEAQLVTRLEAV